MAPKRKAPDSEEDEDLEEEVLSSAEDEEMEGSGDEEEEESEEEIVEPKVLTRANRGGRMGQVCPALLQCSPRSLPLPAHSARIPV